jgi:drug/metabolite transporter (DMT)-like permease
VAEGAAGLSNLPLGVALALLATVCFSFAILLSTVGSRRLDSDAGALLAGAANVPVGLALVGLQALAGGWPAAPTAWGLTAFALGGLCATFLGRWLFFSSIRLLGPTRATVFQTLSPLAAALMAWGLLGERLTWAGWLGMGLAAAGLVVMTQRGRGAPAVQAMPRIALAFGFGSAVAYAGGSIFRASALESWNEALAGAAVGAVAGFGMLLLAARRRLPGVRAQIAAHPRSAQLFVGVGTLQIVAQGLMIASLNHIPVSLTVLLTSCTPLLVMPLSAWLLRRDETLDARAVIGVVVTCAGVALATGWGAPR